MLAASNIFWQLIAVCQASGVGRVWWEPFMAPSWKNPNGEQGTQSSAVLPYCLLSDASEVLTKGNLWNLFKYKDLYLHFMGLRVQKTKNDMKMVWEHGLQEFRWVYSIGGRGRLDFTGARKGCPLRVSEWFTSQCSCEPFRLWHSTAIVMS